MTDDSENMSDLDAFFQAGRQEAPDPSAALMSRIMGDIDMVADEREAPVPQTPKKRLFARLLEGLGGWPAVSGMATAGIVGIVVGVSPPDAISEFTSAYVNGTTDLYLVDQYDSFGFESFEG